NRSRCASCRGSTSLRANAIRPSHAVRTSSGSSMAMADTAAPTRGFDVRRGSKRAKRVGEDHLLHRFAVDRTVAAADGIADRYVRARVPTVRQLQQLAHFEVLET